MEDGAFANDAIAEEEAAVVDFDAARVAGYGTTGPLLVACFAAGTGIGLIASTRRVCGRDLRDFGDDCATATDVDEEAETTLVCEAANAGRGGVLGRSLSIRCEGAFALSGLWARDDTAAGAFADSRF